MTKLSIQSAQRLQPHGGSANGAVARGILHSSSEDKLGLLVGNLKGHAELTITHRQRVEEAAASAGLTTRDPAAGAIAGLEPEFVRVGDLRTLAGLKRGYAYLKIKDGTFRSITLREPGKKFGVRLVFWPSVKAWLHGLLEAQNPSTPSQNA